MRKIFLSNLYLLTILLIFSGNSFSATYYVSKTGDDSNDGSTWNLALLNVKTALAKTVSGDKVWVSRGTYIEGETIEINSGVLLCGGFAGNETSADDRDTSENKTIIDGNKTYRCITNSGTIDGLYIQNGKSETGGGVSNSGGTIANCKITGNSANSASGSNPLNSYCYGGGIYNIGGTIINCVISGNSAYNSSNPFPVTAINCYGGGVYNQSGIIENCSISGNTSNSNAASMGSPSSASSSSHGGGVYNYLGTINNSSIIDNSSYSYADANSSVPPALATSTSRGGGVYNKEGKVSNCRIMKNTGNAESNSSTSDENSSSFGGGLFNESGTVENCIIGLNDLASDKTLAPVFYGVGVYTASGTIVNSTIVKNTAPGIGIYNNSGEIINCIIREHTDADYGNNTGTISHSCFKESDESNGNINADPIFVDVSAADPLKWDLRLKSNSPCIDTGTTVSIFLDIDGIPRPQGAGWDMGVYEYFITTAGDTNFDGKIDSFDVKNIRDYLCGFINFSTSQKNLADINNDGKLNIADIIIILNLINK